MALGIADQDKRSRIPENGGREASLRISDVFPAQSADPSPSFFEPPENEREIKEIIEALQPLPENGRRCFDIDWKKERLRYKSEKLEAEMEAEEEKRHLARAAKRPNQEFEELKKSVKKLCDGGLVNDSQRRS
jgi:uncharacterized protein YhaN